MDALTLTERRGVRHQAGQKALNGAKGVSRFHCRLAHSHRLACHCGCLAHPCSSRLAIPFCSLVRGRTSDEKLHHVDGARPVAGPVPIQGGGGLRADELQHVEAEVLQMEGRGGWNDSEVFIERVLRHAAESA